MHTRAIGNRGRVFGAGANPLNGIGKIALVNDVNWVGVSGKAGDKVPLSFGNVCPCAPNLGLAVQSAVAVTLEFTLANLASALSPDPNDQAMVPWGNSLTLAAGEIQSIEFPFSAVLITFTASGEVYFAAR
jgi:hypothetical protein